MFMSIFMRRLIPNVPAPKFIHGSQTQVEDFLCLTSRKGILVSYDMAIYDLAPTTFRLITCFKLLNQWYGANLGLQEFKVLYRAHKNYDGYYFTLKPSLIWEPYILGVPWQDKDWFKDILVVDRDWERDTAGVRVRATSSPNPQFNNELADIGVCQPELINRAMQIHTKHCNQKWLSSPVRFSKHRKSLAVNHCSKFPIMDLEWIEAKNIHERIHFFKSKNFPNSRKEKKVNDPVLPFQYCQLLLTQHVRRYHIRHFRIKKRRKGL